MMDFAASLFVGLVFAAACRLCRSGEILPNSTK